MNKVHTFEGELRTRARLLLEEMEKQNVFGLVLEEDVQRAYRMHNEELVAHAEMLAARGDQVWGCEAIAEALRASAQAYRRVLRLDEERVATCKMFWQLAHRTSSNATF